jgi:hypothetical protein
MTGACVAGVSLIKGICRVCGLDVIEVKGATGGMDTDMLAKAKAAIHLLDTYDFVLMNVKAADIASHDGNPELKVKVVERLDEMAGVIRSEMPEGRSGSSIIAHPLRPRTTAETSPAAHLAEAWYAMPMPVMMSYSHAIKRSGKGHHAFVIDGRGA